MEIRTDDIWSQRTANKGAPVSTPLRTGFDAQVFSPNTEDKLSPEMSGSFDLSQWNSERVGESAGCGPEPRQANRPKRVYQE